MPAEERPVRPEAPALGALLAQRGLLTQAQLAVALEEQQRTGRRLGDLIVELRFASAASVAQALATQNGGFARTEFGVAFGFETGTGNRRPFREPPVTTRQTHTSQAPSLANEFGLRVAPATQREN